MNTGPNQYNNRNDGNLLRGSVHSSSIADDMNDKRRSLIFSTPQIPVPSINRVNEISPLNNTYQLQLPNPRIQSVNNQFENQNSTSFNNYYQQNFKNIVLNNQSNNDFNPYVVNYQNKDENNIYNGVIYNSKKINNNNNHNLNYQMPTYANRGYNIN